MGLVLGMTTWAGTALASSSSSPTARTLQSQISALQRRLSQDDSAISGPQALLRGVTRSRDGSTLIIAGHGGESRSALKTVLFKGVNVQVVNGTGIETALNGLGNLIIGYADNTGGAARTGSHNLITGDDGGWSSYGGLLAGDFNQIHGPFDAIRAGGPAPQEASTPPWPAALATSPPASRERGDRHPRQLRVLPGFADHLAPLAPAPLDAGNYSLGE